jgi:hypothetical protein
MKRWTKDLSNRTLLELLLETKGLGVRDDEKVVQRPSAEGALVVPPSLLRAKDGKGLFVCEVEQADEAVRNRNFLKLGAVDLE